MPLSWCILAQTNSYKEAVEHNISAGGDSAGRSLIIGSLAGAAYGLDAIPAAWSSKLDNAETLRALAKPT
jgi:ADP-ribosylglycohydrolase